MGTFRVTFGDVEACQVARPAAATCRVLDAPAGFFYAFLGFRWGFGLFRLFSFCLIFPRFWRKTNFARDFFCGKKCAFTRSTYLLCMEEHICFHEKHNYVLQICFREKHSCTSPKKGKAHPVLQKKSENPQPCFLTLFFLFVFVYFA